MHNVDQMYTDIKLGFNNQYVIKFKVSNIFNVTFLNICVGKPKSEACNGSYIFISFIITLAFNQNFKKLTTLHSCV